MCFFLLKPDNEGTTSFIILLFINWRKLMKTIHYIFYSQPEIDVLKFNVHMEYCDTKVIEANVWSVFVMILVLENNAQVVQNVQ